VGLEQHPTTGFVSAPTLTPTGDTRQPVLSGHTAKSDNLHWSAALVVKMRIDGSGGSARSAGA
jgi:hypothetical protein